MKAKDIKKRFKRAIKSGWREYLDIVIDKKHFGFEGIDLPSEANICKVLDLEPHEDSGLVGHYYLQDPSKYKDGKVYGVHINFREWFIRDGETLESEVEFIKARLGFESNEIDNFYVQHDDRLYYLEAREGYINPKYKPFDYNDENATPSNEPYWDNRDETWEGTYCGNDAIKLLELYKNGQIIEDSLYSQDFILKLVSGKEREAINELSVDLGNLSYLTKSLYFKYDKDDIIITFAIRYNENVEPFLKGLKKIIKKHKNVNIRCK